MIQLSKKCIHLHFIEYKGEKEEVEIGRTAKSACAEDEQKICERKRKVKNRQHKKSVNSQCEVITNSMEFKEFFASTGRNGSQCDRFYHETSKKP